MSIKLKFCFLENNKDVYINHSMEEMSKEENIKGTILLKGKDSSKWCHYLPSRKDIKIEDANNSKWSFLWSRRMLQIRKKI